jgi:hypothetical protein
LFQENDGAKPQSHISKSRNLHEPDAGKRNSLQNTGESAPKRTKTKDAFVDDDYEFTERATNRNTARDEFSIFGEHVAFKIRNLKDRRSQSIAQFEISSILFQIEMGNFRYPTHSRTTNTTPTAAQVPDSGEGISQVQPSTHYPTVSPVVMLQSGFSQVQESGSPASQVSQLSPQSLHSNSSVAEDTN